MRMNSTNSTATDTRCPDFRCSLIPDVVVVYICLSTLPFLASTGITSYILHLARWRLYNVRYIVANFNWKFLHQTPFSFSSRSPIVILFLRLFCYLPILSIVFLASITWYELKPYYSNNYYPAAVAVGLATAGFEIIVFGYGFMHWYVRQFRLSFVPQISLVLCILALVVFQFVLSFLVINTLRGVFVVLMLYNLLPLVLNSYLYQYMAPHLTFNMMLSLRPNDQDFIDLCQRRRKLMNRVVVAGTIISLILLFALAYVSYERYASYIGIRVASGIICCDILLLLYHYSGLLKSSFLMVLCFIGVRLVFFGLWEEFWWLAMSVNHFCLTMLLVLYVLQMYIPLWTKEEVLDVAVGSIEASVSSTSPEKSMSSPATKQSYRDLQDAFDFARATSLRKKKLEKSLLNGNKYIDLSVANSVVKDLVSNAGGFLDKISSFKLKNSYTSSPVVSLMLWIILYFAYTMTSLTCDLLNVDWYQEVFPSVNVGEFTAQQWHIGVFELMLIIALSAGIASYRRFIQAGCKINFVDASLGAIYVVVLIGAFYLLSFQADSDYIFIFGIYGPPLSLVAIYTFCMWRLQDYHWNSWRVNHPSDARFGGVWIIAALIDFFAFRHTLNDYILLFGVGLNIGFCSVIGAQLAGYVDRMVAYILAEVLGLGILTVFQILKYYAVLRVGVINLITYGGLIGHTAYELHQIGASVAASVAFALMLPSACALFMALYSWKSMNWQVSLKEIQAIFFSTLAYAIFIGYLTIVEELYFVAILLLVVGSLCIIIVILAMIWSAHDFTLPPIYRNIGFGSYTVISSAAFALYLFLDPYWVWSLGAALLLITLLLVPLIIHDLRTGIDRRITTSASIFPVFVYKPSLTIPEVKMENRGFICLFAIPSMLVFWGIVAGMLLTPSYAGWTVFSAGILLYAVIVCHALILPPVQFWSRWPLIEEYPKLIEEIRLVVLAYYLQKDRQDDVDLPCQSSKETEQSTNPEDVSMVMDSPQDLFSPTRTKMRVNMPTSDGTTTNTRWIVNSDTKYKQLNDGPDRKPKQPTRSSHPMLYTTSADQSISDIRYFWTWQARQSINALNDQKRALFSYPRELPGIKELDPRESAQEITSHIRTLDKRLNEAHTDESYAVLAFQLYCIVSADAVREKNRARIKDFLRAYDSRSPGNQKKVLDMSVTELLEWIETHQDSIQNEKEGYVVDSIETIAALKTKEEEERLAAAQRRRFANQRDLVGIKRFFPLVESLSQFNSKANTPSEVTKPIHSEHNPLSSPSSIRLKPLTVEPKPPTSISEQILALDIRGATPIDVVQHARDRIAQILEKKEDLVSPQFREFSELFHDSSFPLSPVASFLPDNSSQAAVATSPRLKIPSKASPSDSATDQKNDEGMHQQGKYHWLRPKDFLPTPHFVTDDFHSNRIIQGDLEDCYLLSALSVLSSPAHRYRLEQLMIVTDYNPHGFYGMAFYQNGEWRAVFVDDMFPVKQLDDAVQWLFARSRLHEEIWVSVVEKCYAKLYAVYSSIIGGLVHESLQDLTGGAVEEIALDPSLLHGDNNTVMQSTTISSLTLWSRLMAYFKQGYFMGCGNPKGTAGQTFIKDGIVQGHAYAILDIREADGIRLLCLRNPWGETQWEGDWGPTSSVWTQRTRKIFGYYAYQKDRNSTSLQNNNPMLRSMRSVSRNSIFGSKAILHSPQAQDIIEEDSAGVFFMSFHDFLLNFQRVYICRLFDHVVDNVANDETIVNNEDNDEIRDHLTLPTSAGGQKSSSSIIWYRQMVHDEWKGVSAAGCPAFISRGGKPENNPHYLLSVNGNRPTLFFLTLTQPTRTDSSTYVYMALLIVSSRGQRVRNLNKNMLVSTDQKFRNQREVSVEFEAQPGSVYTVLLCTYRPGEESKFTLTVHSRRQFLLKKLLDGNPQR